MPTVYRWLDYLNEMQVPYSHSVHAEAWTARETASADRVPAHEFAKTVVYRSEKGFGMAVVPADQLVDLGRLGDLLGLEYVRLADEAELADLFPGCELGAMPPFGPLFRMPVVVDAEMATEFIAFALGTHRDVARMSFGDFRRLTRPLVATITASISAGHDVLV
jgi:Ala-tRNA(Pro) deacylase